MHSPTPDLEVLSNALVLVVCGGLAFSSVLWLGFELMGARIDLPLIVRTGFSPTDPAACGRLSASAAERRHVYRGAATGAWASARRRAMSIRALQPHGVRSIPPGTRCVIPRRDRDTLRTLLALSVPR